MASSQRTPDPAAPSENFCPDALVATVRTFGRTQFLQASDAPAYLLVETRALSTYAAEQLESRVARAPEQPGLPMTHVATEVVTAREGGEEIAFEDGHTFIDRLQRAFAHQMGIIAPLRRDRPQITLGRSTATDLSIKHASVSKTHLSFHYDSARDLFVTDEHTKNGTRLDGAPLTPGEPAPLRSGQALSLGRIRMFVVDAGVLWDLLRDTPTLPPPSR